MISASVGNACARHPRVKQNSFQATYECDADRNSVVCVGPRWNTPKRHRQCSDEAVIHPHVPYVEPSAKRDRVRNAPCYVKLHPSQQLALFPHHREVAALQGHRRCGLELGLHRTPLKGDLYNESLQGKRSNVAQHIVVNWRMDGLHRSPRNTCAV